MKHVVLDVNKQKVIKRLIKCECDAQEFFSYYKMYKNIQKHGVGWNPLKSRLKLVNIGFPKSAGQFVSTLGNLTFDGERVVGFTLNFKSQSTKFLKEIIVVFNLA